MGKLALACATKRAVVHAFYEKMGRKASEYNLKGPDGKLCKAAYDKARAVLSKLQEAGTISIDAVGNITVLLSTD